MKRSQSLVLERPSSKIMNSFSSKLKHPLNDTNGVQFKKRASIELITECNPVKTIDNPDSCIYLKMLNEGIILEHLLKENNFQIVSFNYDDVNKSLLKIVEDLFKQKYSKLKPIKYIIKGTTKRISWIPMSTILGIKNLVKRNTSKKHKLKSGQTYGKLNRLSRKSRKHRKRRK